MKGTAEFDSSEKFRYTLTRRWSEEPMCCFIGLNPSTADAQVEDNTVRRCRIYAQDWGFGGLLMLNLFAFRATNPKEMFKAKMRGVDIIGGERNWYAGLQSTIGRFQPGLVIAAWGIDGGERGFKALECIRSPKGELHVLGWNKDKSPKHPLYLAKSLRPILVQ